MFADKLYTLSDEALLTHYHQTRELKAFKLIYLRHKDCLYRYCVQMSRRHCSKILQSLWSSLLEQPPKLGGRLLRSWLFIQANRLMQGGDFNAPAPEDLQPEDGSSDTFATSNPKQAQFLQAIQQLPRLQRNVFLLHAECGLSLASIADIERLSLKQCTEHFRESKNSLEVLIYGHPRRRWQTSRSKRSVSERASIPQTEVKAAKEIATGKGMKEKFISTIKGVEVAAV